MINLISKKMVHFFIRQNAIKNEDEEVYLYGIQLIVSMSMSFLSTFTLTLMFSTWYYFFIFFMFFIPLRLYTGGYHAESYGGCFLTTNVVYIIYIILLNPRFDIPNYINIAVLILSVCIIFRFAPIIHKNNIVTDEIIKSRKLLSRILITIYTLLSIIMILTNVNYNIIKSLILTIASVTISIAISIIQERRENK